MPDLASFQRDFAAALMLDGDAAVTFGSQAFAVYRNTSARGAVEALRSAYPTVDMLVGEEMFTQVALDFRKEQPPAGPVLSDYGAGFAAFLARQPWMCELPYLADIARLDRLWLESFLAADLPALPKSVGANARIILHPATRLAWLATPAMTIWQAHRQPQAIVELDLDWAEEGALFTRPATAVHAEKIDPAFHRLLIAFAGAKSVAEVVPEIALEFPRADVPDLLHRGVVTGALIVV